MNLLWDFMFLDLEDWRTASINFHCHVSKSHSYLTPTGPSQSTPAQLTQIAAQTTTFANVQCVRVRMGGGRWMVIDGCGICCEGRGAWDRVKLLCEACRCLCSTRAIVCTLGFSLRYP